MTQEETEKRIADLEREVAELRGKLGAKEELNAFKKIADEFEKQTKKEYIPYPYPTPYYPPYPHYPYWQPWTVC
jgi:hypothetical protein